MEIGASARSPTTSTTHKLQKVHLNASRAEGTADSRVELDFLKFPRPIRRGSSSGYGVVVASCIRRESHQAASAKRVNVVMSQAAFAQVISWIALASATLVVKIA